MIKSWLERKFSGMQQKEADFFLKSLMGADTEQVTLVLAYTMVWASIYKKTGFDLYQVINWIDEKPTIIFAIQKNHKGCQNRKEYEYAAGIKTWIHTVRAAQHIELRYTCRLIWSELGRATDDANKIARGILNPSGQDIYYHAKQVPYGFEAISR